MAIAKNYLLAQAELGAYELVLKEEEAVVREEEAEAHILPQPPAPLPAENDNLWASAQNASEFYEALKQHSLYKKSTRQSSFETPKEKKNAPYILVLHSPKELNAEAIDILKRLFKKLGSDFEACAVSFFIKSNSAVMPREKATLAEMLKKEIALLNPERVIFFRESPGAAGEKTAKIDGNTSVFAGKAAITLYSPLEMLPSVEKMRETLNFLQRSNWFGFF